MISGLGISLLNFHYYDKFTVYESAPNETASAQATPSGVLKDTLYTVFHLSANQMTDVDTHLGSGSAQDLRFVESITGGRVLYPNETPLHLKGWAFPTSDNANLELAITDSNGQPLAYAEFENSEDVYLANMELAASRVSRFTLRCSGNRFESGFPLCLSERRTNRPSSRRKNQYRRKEIPSLFRGSRNTDRSRPVHYTKNSKGIKNVLTDLQNPGDTCNHSDGNRIHRNFPFSLKSGNKIFQRWIFLTGTGITALFSIILNCIFYPSQAGLDPAAYSSGAWLLTQILMALSIVWFVKPLKLRKK